MCSFLESDDDDDDEGEKRCDDFSGKGGEKGDFSHELVHSMTKPVVFGGVCWAPVVTTQASAKGAASTKQWVVATLFDEDWCSGNLPVGVVIGGMQYCRLSRLFRTLVEDYK